MKDLSLHILDIAENSIEADSKNIWIRIIEDRSKNLLSLEIEDDGRGMDAGTVRAALDPFFTTKKTRRFGLGLPLLAQAAEQAGGKLRILSQPGRGTKINVTFVLDHIDTKPLGDIAQTLLTLIVGHPEVDFYYSQRVNDRRYAFRTKTLRAQLEGLPLSSPETIRWIRQNIRQGLDKLRKPKGKKYLSNTVDS